MKCISWEANHYIYLYVPSRAPYNRTVQGDGNILISASSTAELLISEIFFFINVQIRSENLNNSEIIFRISLRKRIGI